MQIQYGDLDGHISGLVHSRDNLKPLLPTKLPTPYRLVPVPCMSRDHTTSGLAFLVFRSHMNRRKRPHGNVPGRGTCRKLGHRGPRTGGHGVARVDSDHANATMATRFAANKTSTLWSRRNATGLAI